MSVLVRQYLPAQAVEVAVEDILRNYSDDEKLEVFSEPWHNGRENGFCFWVVVSGPRGGQAAAFVAECRNSDQLTVTYANTSEWDMITEKQYKDREFFPRGWYNQVAATVVAFLGVAEKRGC